MCFPKLIPRRGSSLFLKACGTVVDVEANRIVKVKVEPLDGQQRKVGE